MESASEQEGHQPPMTSAERKREKDKNRARHGKLQKKRMHVFNNPAKIAFRGWEDEPSPWSLITCEDYIEWCHLSKLFAPHRHLINRRMNKANLKYCTNEEFKRRALQAHQYLYEVEFMPRNDCPLYLCRMVYAEVILKKRVDWRSVRKTPKMPKVWILMDMPREQHPRFPFAALGPQRNDATEDIPVVESDSSTDSDSDGKRTRRPSMTPVARASRQKRQRVKLQQGATTALQLQVHEEQQHINIGLNVVPIEHVPSTTPNLNNTPVEDVAMMDVAVHVSATEEEALEPRTIGVGGNPQEQMMEEMRAKDEVIARLQEEIKRLTLECTQKSEIIAKQSIEIERLSNKDTIAINDHVNDDGGSHAIESQNNVNDAINVGNVGTPRENVGDVRRLEEPNIDNVISNITTCLVDSSPTPLVNRIARRPTVFLPPIQVEAQPHMDVVGTQDSLSFPTSDNGMEVEQLRAANEVLRKRIGELSKQYYQWKVACILNVDRARQMAVEFKKIDNEYLSFNTRRDFGLTSWAHIDEMFPSDMPMRDARSIDWAKLGWDHENAISSHGLRPSEVVASRKLWPTPAPFTQNGDDCSVCLNPFGPEGAYALGTCRCLYHPMCLLGGLLTRRFCAKCRAPFHERLYELFGLTIYMPPSWELNPENAPQREHANRWGEDLLWSWRASTHQLDKSNISSQIGWENDHEEIVRVCKKLIPGNTTTDVGRRNFFYQVMGGYWDAVRRRFQFGRHPEGLLWNNQGRLVSNSGEETDLDIRNALQWEESQWKETWKEEAIDFLLEAHSPETMRTLNALRNSNMLTALINSDGPHRRTRAARRLITDGAGPSNSGHGGASTSAGNEGDEGRTPIERSRGQGT